MLGCVNFGFFCAFQTRYNMDKVVWRQVWLSVGHAAGEGFIAVYIPVF